MSKGDSNSGGSTTYPSTFIEYLTSLVGENVRLTISNGPVGGGPIFGATELVGILEAVETNYVVLGKPMTGNGVPLSVPRVSIETSDLLAVDRISPNEFLLPLLIECLHGSF